MKTHLNSVEQMTNHLKENEMIPLSPTIYKKQIQNGLKNYSSLIIQLSN